MQEPSASMTFGPCVAGSDTLLPAGQAGTGSWLFPSPFSNLKTYAHVGQADMGRRAKERRANCGGRLFSPLLACPAGAKVFQLKPSPPIIASPVGLSNRKESFYGCGGKPIEPGFASRNPFKCFSAPDSDSKSISMTNQFSSAFSSVNTMKPSRWPSGCL